MAANCRVRYIYDGNVVIQERDGNNLPATTYTRGQGLERVVARGWRNWPLAGAADNTQTAYPAIPIATFLLSL